MYIYIYIHRFMFLPLFGLTYIYIYIESHVHPYAVWPAVRNIGGSSFEAEASAPRPLTYLTETGRDLRYEQ